MRIAATFARRAAIASGARRLAVRARPGPRPDQIVVAFPWRRRDAAQALAHEAAAGMEALLSGRSPTRLAAAAGARLSSADPGPEPVVPDPDVPVVQVTGTNGKTTTVRLLAHIVRSAGLRVAYSSTDGVYRDDGELIEQGDYSGFGGAAMALAQRPDVAVLETARGGLLLRGSGVLHNDVAVVTNVSEDHLGLQGVDTVDQLAEVKAIITKITRPGGWDVLNADDPRVLAMRRHATGRPWVFSLDPDHPAFREVLSGRRPRHDRDGRQDDVAPGARIAPPGEPAGRPREHGRRVQRLHAERHGRGRGRPRGGRAGPGGRQGLRTFVPDAERNPGRANVFTLDGRIIVIDYAHNEAGMMGLTELLDGLRVPGREVWVAICTAGDRTDAILRAFAFRAAVGSDHLAVAELVHYLRGRSREDLLDQMRAGAGDAGVFDVPVHEDELHALRAMLRASEPGDVISVTALGMRPEIFAWLKRRGAKRAGPADVKRLVKRARAGSGPAT